MSRYFFKSRSHDVDFDRIALENPDADFLEIEVNANDHIARMLFATAKGKRRLRAAGMGSRWRALTSVSVSERGRFQYSAEPSGEYKCVYMVLTPDGMPITSPGHLTHLCAELRHREEQVTVHVIAIN